MINDEGCLVLTMSDGTSINAGLVRDNSGASEASTTRTIAIIAAICSGISLLWNIISLVIALTGRKRAVNA